MTYALSTTTVGDDRVPYSSMDALRRLGCAGVPISSEPNTTMESTFSVTSVVLLNRRPPSMTSLPVATTQQRMR